MSIQSKTKFIFSIEPLQSKQVHVTFDQNDEPNERYECKFAAYLEVCMIFLSYLTIFSLCLGCTF
jgi:hypothetical protein